MDQAKQFSFRILTIVIVLTLIVVSFRIYSQYRFGQELAVSAIRSSFDAVVTQITTNNRHIDQKINTVLMLAEDFQGINDPVSHQGLPRVFNSFVKSLEQNQSVLSIYVGFENGDFSQVINVSNDESAQMAYEVPKNSHWVISTVSKEDQHQFRRYKYYDADFNFISSQKKSHNLIPSSRPWYKAAINSSEIIKTQPYYFMPLNAPGITYAKRISNQQAVIGVDVTTMQLNGILAEQRPTEDSEIFIFKKSGQKTFSSSIKGTQISQQKAGLIELSQQEKDFIASKSNFYISNQMNYSPFDFAEGGIAKGYSVDLMNLLFAKTNIQASFVNGLTWNQILEEFNAGTIDMIHTMYYSKEREELGLFTDPYYIRLAYFITREEEAVINSFEDLRGKRVAAAKNWRITNYIEKYHPDIEYVEHNSALSVLWAVSDGDVDVAIDSKDRASHLINSYSIENIKFNNLLPKESGLQQEGLHIILHKDQQLLHSIMQKALDSVTLNEFDSLFTKWGLSGEKNKKNNEYVVSAEFLKFFKTKEKAEVFEFKIDDQTYYASHRELHSMGYNESEADILGLIVPKSTLLAPYYKKILNSILLAIVILTLFLPLIYWFMIQPIRKMAMMSSHIKKRNYHKVVPVNTRIKEYRNLSNSLTNMSISIQQHEKSQKDLLDSIIKLIAEAIDAKSHYTAGHCERVPVIAKMLLDAANEDRDFKFKEFQMTDENDLRAYEIGTWLHDCGKITTPEHIVDKATKLETIYNRIHEIRTRFEVLWRDAEIEYYQARIEGASQELALDKKTKTQQQLIKDFEFIAQCNIGSEFLSVENKQRIEQIAQKSWQRNFNDRLGLSEIEKLRFKDQQKDNLPVKEKLLDDKISHQIPREHFDFKAYQAEGFKLEVPDLLYNLGEVHNLSISRGTLTIEDRFKINEHIIMSIKMLERLPFPQEYQNVVEYAGTHHETLIGTGYPRKLKKEDMSIPARIMVIADIFEALTAADRPYKKAKTLSQSLSILQNMRDEQHIDPDLYELFLRSGIYLEYAKTYLKEDQLENIDINNFL